MKLGAIEFYLDTMMWVYYFERNPQLFPAASAVLTKIHTGNHAICASHLVLAEVLVLPKRKGDIFTAAQYRRFFLSSQVDLIALGQDAAERFADIRACSKVKPADALHLALAASAGVDYFVTNDTKLHALTLPGISHICPPEAIS